MMMMLISLFPAMATSFSAKKMATPTQQPATPMGTMPRLQTLSTDAFTPVNSQRSGENPLELFIRQTANKRLQQLAKGLETSHLTIEQIEQLAAAFTARDNSGLHREIVPLQNQKEEALKALLEEFAPPETVEAPTTPKKNKRK